MGLARPIPSIEKLIEVRMKLEFGRNSVTIVFGRLQETEVRLSTGVDREQIELEGCATLEPNAVADEIDFHCLIDPEPHIGSRAEPSEIDAGFFRLESPRDDRREKPSCGSKRRFRDEIDLEVVAKSQICRFEERASMSLAAPEEHELFHRAIIFHEKGLAQAVFSCHRAHSRETLEGMTTQGTTHSSLAIAHRLELRQKKLKARIEKTRARLKTYQNSRLATGVIFFLALIVLTLRPELRLELPVLAVFLGLFIWLVIATRRIARFLERLERLNVFFDRQRRRALGGQPPEREWKQVIEIAEKMRLPRDLGLFGAQSFWTLIDETVTDGGLKRLLQWISEEPRPRDEILRRQNLIRSLRQEAWFFTRLTLEASGKNESRLSSSQVEAFLSQSFVEGRFQLVFALNLFVWLGALAVVILAMQMGWGIGGYAVLVFSAVSLGSVNKVISAFGKGVGLAHHLSELAPLFAALEKRLGWNLRLRTLFPQTYGEGPSRQVRKLNRVLAFLGTQTNPLLHLLLNAFLPWTITAAFFLERRRKRIQNTFPVCMSELAEFEALGSLVILDRYQTRVYPVVQEGAHSLDLKAVFHPLLDRKKVVANDFAFAGGKSLGLLTGSNMSGKSTFLRTVGLNQILANIGAPVFADAMTTAPLKIETCIEVSDSLRDGFSYFYAEVRRLRDILSSATSDLAGQPVLYLIDEIFRGTNNRERQIGSRAVIRSLASSRTAIGFVSTHDLELVSLETTSPRILNLHFREDIDAAGKMVFSYHLRPGPCPTTNALKIMQAEGIDLTGAEDG